MTEGVSSLAKLAFVAIKNRIPPREIGRLAANQMTALLLPPPAAESYRQLDFSWDEAPAISEMATDFRGSAETTEELTECIAETRAEKELPPAASEPSQEGILRFREDAETGVRRIAEPVRIGGVMIKLLKRYGITDAEISEGLANYAAKQGRLAAS